MGIERDVNTPAPVRRLVRLLARLGARVPKRPRYSEAFRAIGPAAIKLGQTLATRPDLVGEEATRDLLTLQDALPPVPFAAICKVVESALGRPIEALYSRFDEHPVGAASIAQVHRAWTTEGREVAVKVLRPGIANSSHRTSALMNGRPRMEQLGGEAGGCALASLSPTSSAGPRASLICGARRRHPQNLPRRWRPSRAMPSPRSTGTAPPGG